MKFVILLFVFCYVQCRKTYPPLDKHANLAFINMEGGGGVRPGGQPQVPQGAPAKPPTPPVNPAATVKPAVAPTPKPVVLPAPAKPQVLPPSPTPPNAAPHTTPHQIQPKPVNPAPAARPITTPGPGTVKQLVTFYDSQGKASPIRPYSYSQAVKQG